MADKLSRTLFEILPFPLIFAMVGLLVSLPVKVVHDPEGLLTNLGVLILVLIAGIVAGLAVKRWFDSICKKIENPKNGSKRTLRSHTLVGSLYIMIQFLVMVSPSVMHFLNFSKGISQPTPLSNFAMYLFISTSLVIVGMSWLKFLRGPHA